MRLPGWGWWRSDGNHPFMTAYALSGLAEAKASGETMAVNTPPIKSLPNNGEQQQAGAEVAGAPGVFHMVFRPSVGTAGGEGTSA